MSTSLAWALLQRKSKQRLPHPIHLSDFSLSLYSFSSFELNWNCLELQSLLTPSSFSLILTSFRFSHNYKRSYLLWYQLFMMFPPKQVHFVKCYCGAVVNESACEKAGNTRKVAQIPELEDPLEKKPATHSSILIMDRGDVQATVHGGLELVTTEDLSAHGIEFIYHYTDKLE